MSVLRHATERLTRRVSARSMPIGVDFGAATIRAIQLAPGPQWNRSGPGRLRVHSRVQSERRRESCGSGESPVDLAAELARLLDRGGFRGRHVVLDMDPPELTTVALNLQAESRSPDHPEVQAALSFEVGRHLDYDPAQAEIRAWCLPRGGTSTPTYMGAAARREQILSRVESAERAGYRCGRVDAGACALVRCCVETADPPRLTVWGIMDIGLRATRVIVAANDVAILQREIPVGGSSMTERVMRQFGLSPDAAEQLKRDYGLEVANPSAAHTESDPPENAVGESPLGQDPTDQPQVGDGSESPENRIARIVSAALRRSLVALAGEAEKSMAYGMHVYPEWPASRLYLTGGGASLRGLATALAREIGIEVNLLDPLAVLEPQSRANARADDGPAWAKAVGLALPGA